MRALTPVLALALAAAAPAGADDEAPLSPQTEECLGCHADYHPGLVGDWRASRHSRVTPAQGMAQPEISRRVSSQVTGPGRDYAVGCFECHGANPGTHADEFDHYDVRIHIVVTPRDCATCHQEEARQYDGSKKAHAVGNLELNPVYHGLVQTLTSVRRVGEGGALEAVAGPGSAPSVACFACHGTHVEVAGFREVDVGDDVVRIPELTNWPNQGVGRLNPDGSRGACTACHPRHSFSIETARKPYTCAQCHLEPDVPAWDVYRESKHGNIALSNGAEWDWTHVPWRVGQDFRAPTCATCHNALIATPGNAAIVPRTHDFGDRLWVRIFGLVYSHPQPVSGATHTLVNGDGLPLPTTFGGQLAERGLIGLKEQGRRQRQMVSLCRSCHSTAWSEGFFTRLDSTIAETDRMTAAATQLLSRGWELGLADPANPFDEPLEHKWMRQWLLYANSTRYGAAMSGPDYAAFKNGWFSMTTNLVEMQAAVQGGKR
ncbi:MAG: multiheme c-type cytochrome [Gemmatimonadota bacterium]